MILGKERAAATFPIIRMRNGVCFGMRMDRNLAQGSVRSTAVTFLCHSWGWCSFSGFRGKLDWGVMMSAWVLCWLQWIEFYSVRNCRRQFPNGTQRTGSHQFLRDGPVCGCQLQNTTGPSKGWIRDDFARWREKAICRTASPGHCAVLNILPVALGFSR